MTNEERRIQQIGMDVLIADVLAAEEAIAEEIVGGYPVKVLSAVFDRISDPDDWKGPISATMRGEAVGAAVAAIKFYTATDPKVDLDTRTMQYIVTSPGYRNGPAGDH